MILYKYRSFVNLKYILDIILNQRLYCSTYDELNDPFEGFFLTTTKIKMSDFLRMKIPPPAFVKLPIEIERVREAKALFGGEIGKVKICSLSSDLNDVRLWSYYADGHKGIVFEIDFSGLERIYEVDYPEKLPWKSWWSVPSILAQPSIYEVLSQKTNHWKFESEYRIIIESENLLEGKYFDIKDRIKAVYLGTRTRDTYANEIKLLNKIVPDGIPIYTTNINKEKIIVEPGECIPERKTSP